MDRLRVGVLAYPGCFASEVFGVPDLLVMADHVAAARGSGRPRCEVSVISPRRDVVAAGGCALQVAPPCPVDVLVVPGFAAAPGAGLGRLLAGLRPEVALLRSHAAAGVPVVSICVGAFLLAESGLLDGREATTSWLFADAFRRRYPKVALRPERLVVTDAGVTTTGAFSAMYDFALGFVRDHHGSQIARGTARIALVDDARSSQAPYVDHDLLPPLGREFSRAVKRWLDRRLAARYDLSALAGAFHVSTRTMLRRFGQETGTTPLAYLQAARVRRARHLLEATERSLAAITAEVGYADPSTFSAVFTRHTGMRPRDYRAAFRARPEGAADGGSRTRQAPAAEGPRSPTGPV